MGLHKRTAGATPLGPEDRAGLRLARITTRQELNAAEFRSLAQATAKYLAARPTRRMAPFTRPWMLRLHEEAFGTVWRWAGRVRRSEKNVGVPVHLIETQLDDLARDVAYWRKSPSMPPLEEAVHIHYRGVYIHPFENGNGRWARLLANIWLKQRGAAIVAWPQQAIQGASEIRGAYLAAMRAADKGDFGPLTGLHERYSTSSPDTPAGE